MSIADHSPRRTHSLGEPDSLPPACIPAARALQCVLRARLRRGVREARDVRFLKTLGTLLAVAVVSAAVTVAAFAWVPELLGAPAAASTAVIIWPDAQAERIVAEPPPRVERFTVLAVGDLMVHMPQTSAAKTAS